MADYNAQIDALFPGVDTTPQDKKTAKTAINDVYKSVISIISYLN